MDLMQSFDAILFPADGRPPHVVSLMTSPASFSNPHAPAQTSTARIPHPEVHMEYIAEDPNMRAWNYFPVEALDMMNKKFANPYIIYYPVVSRDGMPFPVNRTVRDIQEEVNKGRRLREDQLWRGNIVAAKFADDQFAQMIDASMADFPILKNFLGTHASPIRVSSAALPVPPPITPTPTPATATAPPPSSPSSSSPPHLPTPRFPVLPPLHPAAMPLSGGGGGAPPQMQFAESASSCPQAYECEPLASAHGVLVSDPHRESKTAGAGQQQQQYQQQQQQHHQPPMEL